MSKSDRECPSAGPHEWTDQDVMSQVNGLLARVAGERARQEQMWGRQNIRDLQDTDDGRNTTGRPYRQWAQIMKYQCDRAASLKRRSMDLVLLEEVFEALERAVELADEYDPQTREKIAAALVEELLQTAAVAVKWAGIIERGEPRHG